MCEYVRMRAHCVCKSDVRVYGKQVDQQVGVAADCSSGAATSRGAEVQMLQVGAQTRVISRFTIIFSL